LNVGFVHILSPLKQFVKSYFYLYKNNLYMVHYIWWAPSDLNREGKIALVGPTGVEPVTLRL